MSDDEKKKPAPKGQIKLCEEWKKSKGTSEWSYAGASGLNDWPLGMELSEKDYDEAIEKFASIKLS